MIYILLLLLLQRVSGYKRAYAYAVHSILLSNKLLPLTPKSLDTPSISRCSTEEIILLLPGGYTLLHGSQVLPCQCILAQTPCHNTPESQLIHNVGELACNHVCRIPCPEHIDLVIKVVLSTHDIVQFGVLLRAPP